MKIYHYVASSLLLYRIEHDKTKQNKTKQTKQNKTRQEESNN